MKEGELVDLLDIKLIASRTNVVGKRAVGGWLKEILDIFSLALLYYMPQNKNV